MNRRVFLTALGAVVTKQKLGSISQLTSGATSDSPLFTVLRSPYMQNVRETSAAILWATFEAGIGSVQYSADGVNFATVTAKSRFFPASEQAMTQNFVQYRSEEHT